MEKWQQQTVLKLLARTMNSTEGLFMPSMASSFLLPKPSGNSFRVRTVKIWSWMQCRKWGGSLPCLVFDRICGHCPFLEWNWRYLILTQKFIRQIHPQGNWTILVPTEEAYRKVNTTQWEAFLANPTLALDTINYHILSNTWYTASIPEDGVEHETILGQTLFFSIEDEGNQTRNQLFDIDPKTS